MEKDMMWSRRYLLTRTGHMANSKRETFGKLQLLEQDSSSHPTICRGYLSPRVTRGEDDVNLCSERWECYRVNFSLHFSLLKHDFNAVLRWNVGPRIKLLLPFWRPCGPIATCVILDRSWQLLIFWHFPVANYYLTFSVISTWVNFTIDSCSLTKVYFGPYSSNLNN